MTEQELYEYAVRLLSKRDYSSRALKNQLLPLSRHNVDAVMEKLLTHHYVDDTRLIEKEINKHIAKLYGEAYIKQALRKKGLDSLLIDQALEDLDIDWFERCLMAKKRKFGMQPPSNTKEKIQMVRYLQSRGHLRAAIMASLR